VSSELSLEEQAQAALVEGDLKWALELSDVLVRTEPDSKSAKTLKAQALRALGEAHISANGRHYYIAQSGEALGEEIPTRTDRSAIPEDFVAGLPMANLMTSMPSKLKAELTLEKDEVVVFQFTDSGAAYSFHIRRGVAELTLGAAEDPDVLISTTEETWKDIVFGRRSPAMAFATGDIDVDGGVVRVAKFLNLFERT
jgi:alkyl sulfatase BDS1-like metallo-beta-lactamase superfamily hydrolase